MKKRTSRTLKKRQKFIEHLSSTGNVTLAAQLAGIGRTVLYEIRNEDAEFAHAWEDALEQSTDRLIEEARRRAYEGVEEPQFYQGDVCGYVRKYSDSLLMFLIKGRRPQYATERRELSGRDGRAIQTENTQEVKFSQEEFLRCWIIEKRKELTNDEPTVV